MRTGTFGFGALILVLTLGLSLRAQTPGTVPDEATPRADEIFENYLAATGGIEARKSLQTLAIAGQFAYGFEHPLGDYSYSYKAFSSDVLEAQLLGRGTTWRADSTRSWAVNKRIGKWKTKKL